jgi:UDP-galactopyranose mutase
MKAIIVGSGFSGATAAFLLAEKGYYVQVLEQRQVIGGNCYDYKDASGIIVQKYGAHLFHTSKKEVYDFLSRFCNWFPYNHYVLGYIDGKLVPIPFNLVSLKTLMPKEQTLTLREKLIQEYGVNLTIPIKKLMANRDPDLAKLGKYIYEKVFLHYTEKQWGMSLDELEPFVSERVPVSISDTSAYFMDTYQAMPVGGFTPIFEKLLKHPNISVELNCEATNKISFRGTEILLNGLPCKYPIIFTGCIDKLFGYCYGMLPYRSVSFEMETLSNTTYQPCGVVNYPNTERFTRIIEFKHFTKLAPDIDTVIAREYPCQYEENFIPYYPVPQQKNLVLYEQYLNKAKNYKNLYLLGRLAEYKYYNMDQAIYSAMKIAEEISTSERYLRFVNEYC